MELYWILLDSGWQQVTPGDKGREGHAYKNLHRWTEELTYEEAYELWFKIESSGFAKVTFDPETKRYPTLIVRPRMTSAVPSSEDSQSSTSDRLEGIITSFMNERR